jgi:opacity protein-like surface antigen
MLRRVVLAGLSTCVLGLTFGFNQSANAQSAYPSVPESVERQLEARGAKLALHINKGRGSFDYREDFCKALADGTKTLAELRDAAINAKVNDQPAAYNALSNVADDLQRGLDKWLDYYVQYCYPEGPPGVDVRNWTAFSLGVYLISINRGDQNTTETSAATGAVTNTFRNIGDPLGVGLAASYYFAPWANNIRVGPFVSFDLLHQTINQTFPSGFFLGTTTHWVLTSGVKGGFVVTPSLFIYGLAGASWLNESLNINFATASSKNTTTPGFTAGLGVEYMPSVLQRFGLPVSIFVQYQHTWWQDATFNTPASSPLFNYTFRREDDTVKVGVNVQFRQ